MDRRGGRGRFGILALALAGSAFAASGAASAAAAPARPDEIDPGENTPAPVRTECFVLYDPGHLYVACRAHDPDPSAIRAHLADRDQVDRDDAVGFIVDTFNDERRGFEMFVNPLNVQTDASRNDVGRGDDLGGESTEDSTWDAIWTSAARITPEGYEVEIAVPFTSLRFQAIRSDTLYPAQVAGTFNQPADPFVGSAATLRYNHDSRDWNLWGNDGVTYDKTSGEFFFNIRPTGDLTLSLGGHLGDAVDYDNSRPATLIRLTPGLTCDFGRHMHLHLDHACEGLDEKGGRLYLANLTQLRLVYQWSTRMSARAILQYTDTLKAVARYDPVLNPGSVQPRESQLLTHLLVSCKVNPQTLVYIGYSETRTNEDTADLHPLEKDRSIFSKIGCAWIS